MRLLTFTSLYPNAVTPSHGVFVENRLVHLVESGGASAVVVAPVPWFPFRHRRFGRYAEFARVPADEERHGIRVLHPRYFTVPVLGQWFAPVAMALTGRAAALRLFAAGERFDAIDAHYFFPDGVAAALLGRWLKLPVVITARGSDVNLIAQRPVQGRLIRWAARSAAHLITVSSALREALTAVGIERDKITVLRNGVDSEVFRPVDRAAARAHHGLPADARVVISVGRLHAGKGHDLVIEAVAAMPGTHLLIAGNGEERQALQQRIEALGVADRVTLTGAIAHDRLALLYSCADALVLASDREGWPNVLLESMACGTPVAATDVGGIREVVGAPEAGVLIQARTAAAIEAALEALLAAPPDRDATRRYAERFSWEDTSRGQERVFAALGVEGDWKPTHPATSK